MKRIILALAAVAMFVFLSGVTTQPTIREYVLFGGSDTDSTEQASFWIPIRDASYVTVRTWTTKAAFHASTDADSTFTDSIAVWKTLFSDSVSAQTAGFFRTVSVGADSSVVTSTIVANVDTTFKMIGVAFPPLQEALRAPGNGSGTYTQVYPVNPGLATKDATGYIHAGFMRIRITPHRRMTVTGGQSTAGKRVNGLKGLRMMAYVVSR